MHGFLATPGQSASLIAAQPDEGRHNQGMKTLLPSGQTTADLRHAAESAIAHRQNILLNPGDLLAILVALDLRERLDRDVERCARYAADDLARKSKFISGLDANEQRTAEATTRVLRHEPLPDLSEAAS